jgi:hypothetical protein
MITSPQDFATAYYLLCLFIVPLLGLMSALFKQSNSVTFVGLNAAFNTLLLVMFYIGLWVLSKPGWVGGVAMYVTALVVVRSWRNK